MTGDLRLDGVTTSYGRAVALRDVSLTCPRGAITLVTGPNGAGKSTLLLSIRGTVQPTGHMTLGGADLRTMTARDAPRPSLSCRRDGSCSRTCRCGRTSR